MKKVFLTSIFALLVSVVAFAQETEVNQYGQKVNSYPVDAAVQDGILVFQNKEQNYKMWFDIRVQGDAAVFFGYDKNLTQIGNGMLMRRTRFAVKVQLDKSGTVSSILTGPAVLLRSRMLTLDLQVSRTLRSRWVTSRRTSLSRETLLHVISSSWSVRW